MGKPNAFVDQTRERDDFEGVNGCDNLEDGRR
jgi:hypothetical protein